MWGRRTLKVIAWLAIAFWRHAALKPARPQNVRARSPVPGARSSFATDPGPAHAVAPEWSVPLADSAPRSIDRVDAARTDPAPVQFRTTRSAIASRQLRILRLLLSIWIVGLVAFGVWWFQASHISTVTGFVITSVVIGYSLLMPAYFFFFLSRIRKPREDLYLPPGYGVTFVTTFVPSSESIEVLERTVRAMRDQEGYPHDVWVLDEGDSPAARMLCSRLGIQHFSRKDRPEYQQAHWPFQARMKAGNYNAWLDWMERQCLHYDIILQMDTDHVPQPGYMMKMIAPFSDPYISYVSAPSIVSGNEDESWIVRARYEVEATLHGALQMGYNAGYGPLIIGSHAAFRAADLMAIGGFQQTWAEDHHNSLRLNASGRYGVFQPDAIAIGDGAAAFRDAMVQERQWARALTQILIKHFPREGRGLRPRVWFQFAFAETWYPVFGLFQLFSWLMPVIALFMGDPWVRVSYPLFLLFYGTLTLVTIGVIFWVRRQGWLRPVDSPVISWRMIVLMVIRWPYVLLGVAEAVLGVLTRRNFEIRVTPKGQRRTETLPLAMLAPYLTFILASLLAIGYHLQRPDRGPQSASDVDGYLYLAFLNAGIYIATVGLVTYRDFRESWRAEGIDFARIRRTFAPVTASLMAATMLAGITLTGASGRMLSAIAWSEPAASEAASPGEVSPPDDPMPAARQALALDVPAGSDELIANAVPRATASGNPEIPTPAPITIVTPRSDPFVGIYQPGAGPLDGRIEVELVFIQWKPDVGMEVEREIQRALANDRMPIISIEPFPWGIGGLEEATLLGDISTGRYDETIAEIASISHRYATQPIYLRFAHEADLDGLYPWSQGDPEAYISAYRRFVEVSREYGGDNLRFIWSPSGNRGSSDYYPGDDVVDMIGISILIYDQWERDAGFSTARSFSALLAEKYPISDKFDKPLIIAETAISLPSAVRERAWLKEIQAVAPHYPRLKGVIYFNDRNPPIRGVEEQPDWRLSPAHLEELLRLYHIPNTAPLKEQ